MNYHNDPDAAEMHGMATAATDEVFEFLDELRESGVTNIMFGARPYIMEEFDLLTKKEASDLLSEWMRTFSERHPS